MVFALLDHHLKMQFGKNGAQENMPCMVMVEKVVGSTGMKKPGNGIIPMVKNHIGLSKEHLTV